ncbi:Sulfate adenylyltransferase [Trichinella spiralis]|uniref:Sulfate adenylyltransferase n=1 Tax=Trichinella spiralis TaxID=6334 RepID=A0ABR3KIZ6_TRISP
MLPSLQKADICRPVALVHSLSRRIWILWRHDRPAKFEENWLKGMKRLEIVATHFDLIKMIVNIIAPLEKPT